ncbi:MAG TPA: hypothetical protein VFR49_05135, partial [Solirubrobacteraceae bacterium]|nr:hypothetical protein [Solirubrobacteraceae bacterium]
MPPRVPRSIVLAGLGAALAGCGGASHPAAAPAGAGPGGQVPVIRAWSQALARGDVAAAAAYFATPSTVQIAPGEPVAVVRSGADARA